jgi:hypothetical protein
MLSSHYNQICIAKPCDAGDGVPVMAAGNNWTLTVFAENAAGDRGGGP